jgi:hypothetical protein
VNPSFYEGVDVATGSFTSISVNRIISKKMPKPYSNCTEYEQIRQSNSKLIQAVLKTDGVYRQTRCFDTCAQQEVIKNCGCQDANYPILDYTVDFCITSSKLACSLLAYLKVYNVSLLSVCHNW